MSQELYEVFISAEQNLTKDENWIFSHTLFGISTFYRREPDDTLSIKLEGELTGAPLFEQLAVLREAHLYDKWAPFVSHSKCVAKLGHADFICWFQTTLPFLVRDCLYRGKGCDCVKESGRILLVGEGIDDKKQHKKSDTNNDNKPMSFSTSYLSKISSDIVTPPRPTGHGAARVELRCFQGAIEVLSTTSCRTRLVANIDPNIEFLPQWLIDFAMKKLAGAMLATLQKAARKAVTNPVKSPHAKVIRTDHAFYKDWLIPKFKAYCKQVNWEIPTIAAFTVDDHVVSFEGTEIHGINRVLKRAKSDDKTKSTKADTDNSIVMNGNLRRSKSDSDSQSVKSVVSLMTLDAWRKKREAKKEKKRQLSVEAARIRARKRLEPRERSDEQNERLGQLLNLTKALVEPSNINANDVREEGEKVKHRKSWIQSAIDTVSEISIFHPIFALIVMMAMLFSNLSLEKRILSNLESNSWGHEFFTLLKTFFLLGVYGAFQISVLWSSNLVIFDTIELTATSSHILIHAKKFFSKKLGYFLVTFTCLIIWCSFTRAFIIVIGRHFKTVLEIPKPLALDASDLNSETKYLILSSWDSMSRYLSSISIFSIPELLCNAFWYLEKAALKQVILFIDGTNLSKLFFYLKFIYDVMNDSGESWERLVIDTASRWMAFTATYSVMLSIIFSIVLKPHKKKAFETTPPSSVVPQISCNENATNVMDDEPFDDTKSMDSSLMSAPITSAFPLQMDSYRDLRSNVTPSSSRLLDAIPEDKVNSDEPISSDILLGEKKSNSSKLRKKIRKPFKMIKKMPKFKKRKSSISMNDDDNDSTSISISSVRVPNENYS